MTTGPILGWDVGGANVKVARIEDDGQSTPDVFECPFSLWREPQRLSAVLTEAADGISAARPGARRDVLESYIKRLAKLEEIAMSYKGVEMCYAIQAGRELRVITKADIVSDLDAYQLAKDISKRIEAEMQYPGHIKVVVIRETRAVEVAK